jgi:hypothetical protein
LIANATDLPGISRRFDQHGSRGGLVFFLSLALLRAAFAARAGRARRLIARRHPRQKLIARRVRRGSGASKCRTAPRAIAHQLKVLAIRCGASNRSACSRLDANGLTAS